MNALRVLIIALVGLFILLLFILVIPIAVLLGLHNAIENLSMKERMHRSGLAHDELNNL